MFLMLLGVVDVIAGLLLALSGTISFTGNGFVLAIAIIVALSVKLVGTLLTAALIAMPAASARNMTKSIKNYAALSVCFGILAPVLWTVP